MSPKNKEKRGTRRGEPSGDGALDGLSSRGKKVMSAGAGAVVLGFIALSRADPMGRNAASLLASFLIVGGYAAIGAGILLPEPPPSASSDHPSEKTS